MMVVRKMKNMMNDEEVEEGDDDKEDDVFRRLIRDHGRCSQTTTFSLRYFCGLSYLSDVSIYVNTYINISHLHYFARPAYAYALSP